MNFISSKLHILSPPWWYSKNFNGGHQKILRQELCLQDIRLKLLLDYLFPSAFPVGFYSNTIYIRMGG